MGGLTEKKSGLIIVDFNIELFFGLFYVENARLFIKCWVFGDWQYTGVD